MKYWGSGQSYYLHAVLLLYMYSVRGSLMRGFLICVYFTFVDALSFT